MWQRLRPYLALTLVCLAVFVPGMTVLPPLDRDEARFAQASKQMLETGDFVRIQFQQTPRNKKPAGAYWLQAASASMLGGAEDAPIWAYRLPSALAAWLSVLAVFGFAAPVVGRRAAFLAALFLAVSLLVIAEAHQAKTDALLLLSVTVAMGALARCHHAAGQRDADPPGWGIALAFWGAIGAGILIKGPITPMVAGLTVVALGIWDRRWRWLKALRPVAGLPLAAVIAAPWFWAVSAATGGAFVGEAVQSDLLPKLLGSQESHGAPPGYYLLLMTVTFWPGSLFAWGGLVHAWQNRNAAATRFLIAWLVPGWILFELIPTKLPHYVLPMYPALALIAAMAFLAAIQRDWRGFLGRDAKISFVVWAIPGIALAGAAAVLPMVYGTGFDPAGLIVGLIVLAATLGALIHAWRGGTGTALRIALVGGAVTGALVLQIVAPRLDALWLSPRAADAVARYRTSADVTVAAAGYHEPSLVFLLGTRTQLTDGGGAAAHLAGSTPGLSLVAGNEIESFNKSAEALGLSPRVLATVSGFNYSRGKPVTLTLYGP